MRGKLSTIFVATVVLGLLVAACAPAPTPTPTPKPVAPTATPVPPTPKPEPIKIGHAVALTGGSALWGQSEANALEMAVEGINAKGGVLGRPIKVITYDERADPAETVSVVKRLITIDKVIAVLGLAQSKVALPCVPVFEAAKIPGISTTATNPYVTVAEDGKLNKYMFRTCFIDEYQGKVAAQFAYDRLGARTAAVLYDVGDDYSQFLGKEFVDSFEARGGKLTTKEAFRTGELDFRAQLGRIKETKPDLLFMPLFQKEAAMACKQAEELGITGVTYMGGDAWGAPELIEIGGPAVEGGYLVNIAALEDPALQDWLKEYRARYGEDPVLPNPLMVVDGLYMLVDAIERAGTTDGPALVEAIEQTKDLPVLTGKLTIDPKTHNPLHKPAVIQEVKGGEFVYVETFTGE